VAVTVFLVETSSFRLRSDGSLRRAFGHSDGLGNLPVAGLDHISFSLFSGKPQVNQKAHDAAVVADEVAHQDVDYVVID
jgi:hypothetical protein